MELGTEETKALLKEAYLKAKKFKGGTRSKDSWLHYALVELLRSKGMRLFDSIGRAEEIINLAIESGWIKVLKEVHGRADWKEIILEI